MDVIGAKETAIWPVNAGVLADWQALLDTPEIAGAAGMIRRGGLVAFPTETVYGLGANGLDPRAVAGIFSAKGRPADNPLILHISDVADLEGIVVGIPIVAAQLMKAFWPGPLTLVLPKASSVPTVTSGGRDTVAVRMPAHPIALALIRGAGVPIAAPSANTSGRPSPTQAEHVVADLWGKIDLILDGGPTGLGVESTVVDCSVMTSMTPTLLRPGGVPVESIELVLTRPLRIPASGKQKQSSGDRRVAPGMKHGHYALKATAALVMGMPPDLYLKLAAAAKAAVHRGKRVGLLVSQETLEYWREHGIDTAHWQIVNMGSRADLAGVAANIYRGLRHLDGIDVTDILLESVPEQGLGLTIMNRLFLAAQARTIH